MVIKVDVRLGGNEGDFRDAFCLIREIIQRFPDEGFRRQFLFHHSEIKTLPCDEAKQL